MTAFNQVVLDHGLCHRDVSHHLQSPLIDNYIKTIFPLVATGDDAFFTDFSMRTVNIQSRRPSTLLQMAIGLHPASSSFLN